MVKAGLDIESVQGALRSLEQEHFSTLDILPVSSSPQSPHAALIVEDIELGLHWTYVEKDVDVVFKDDEKKPIAIGGNNVSIGEKSWSKKEQRLKTLHSPGHPLVQSSKRILRDVYLEKHEKPWGQFTLVVGSDLD